MPCQQLVVHTMCRSYIARKFYQRYKMVVKMAENTALHNATCPFDLTFILFFARSRTSVVCEGGAIATTVEKGVRHSSHRREGAIVSATDVIIGVGRGLCQLWFDAKDSSRLAQQLVNRV